MNFKELFNQTNTFGGAARMGSAKFKLNNSKDAVVTPHYMMRKVKDMLKTSPSLRSGMDQIVNFLFQNVHFESSDEASAEFSNSWIARRKYIIREMKKETLIRLSMGTGYVQELTSTSYNGQEIFDGIKHVPDSSIIYLNMNAKSDDEYWLVEVPTTVKSYDGKKPSYRPVHYIQNDMIWSENIYCIAYPKDFYIQHTHGWSETPFYGWGLLSTAMENEDVANEILKNWSLIAKYRAMGKKLISVKNVDGSPADPGEIDSLRDEFLVAEEEDSIITNKEISSQELAFTGQDNLMNQELDFLRRDSGSTTVPNFMTAFSQDSSMATAREAKIPFSLTLEEFLEENKDIYNDIITRRLKESFDWLADDLTLEFGMPDLYARDEKFNIASMLYNMRAATFNELRMAAGYNPVENGDTWGEKPEQSEHARKKLTVPTEMSKNLQEKIKGNTLSEKVIKNPDRKVMEKVKKATPIEYLTKEEMKEKAKSDKVFKEAVRGVLDD